MRATVCLNMIVKNEARIIERCLSALRPFIDTWVIVDTGSTDGTQDIIRATLKDLPGEVVERPWRNFGHNRTEALRLAEGRADFILLCDADMILQIKDPEWRPDPARDGYFVRQHHDERSFSNIRLINARLTENHTGDRRWCYRGSTHEFIDSVTPDLNDDIIQTDAISFLDPADGGSKADKYSRDAALLEQELLTLETQSGDAQLVDKLKARTVFYLAQTYRDMDEHQKALDTYRRRALMGGWPEEVWNALFEVARMSELVAIEPQIVLQRYLLAYEYRPRRAEPLVELARYCRQRRQYALAHLFASQAISKPQPDDILFVDTTAYTWRAQDEFAVASFWMGHYQACADTCDRLLASGHLPTEQVERVAENQALAMKNIRPAAMVATPAPTGDNACPDRISDRALANQPERPPERSRRVLLRMARRLRRVPTPRWTGKEQSDGR
jgi:glycosyltransferase involved in cell wall biosynthesis